MVSLGVAAGTGPRYRLLNLKAVREVENLETGRKTWSTPQLEQSWAIDLAYWQGKGHETVHMGRLLDDGRRYSLFAGA